MEDQAKRLRELMNKERKINNEIIVGKKAKTLAIASGKGGVGKTNYAINLGISLQNLGSSVVVIDGDIGLSNIEILTGISTKYTIVDLILKDKSIYDIIEEGPKGVKIVSGGFGHYDLSLINDKNLNKLLDEIEKLENFVDFIIFDIGAGISNMVLNFILAADEAILITTPDPTSLMDVYALIKALTIYGYMGKLNIVTNIVENKMDAINVFEKLNKVANNFLNIELEFLGYLERTNLVSKAVRNQQPFVLLSPKANISKRMNIMALKLLDIPTIEKKEKLSFTQKLKSLLFERGR
ncbi:MAG: MinD/ParA family protein [Tissierellia bacterium]|nr:MinD/ParA family protein [Tissierellia bacterium]